MPILSYSNCQQCSDSNKFHSWTEGLKIVQTFLLCIILCHQSCFESLYTSISLKLYFVNPFTSNGHFTSWQRSKKLGLVCLKCCNLSIHSSLPSRISTSLKIGLRFRCNWKSKSKSSVWRGKVIIGNHRLNGKNR